MNSKIATTGNAGPKIRSDCEITMQLTERGGISIDLSSKVKTLYGDSIIDLCKSILKFYNIRDASLKVNDSGALPFVIAARLEAVIRKLVRSELEYLPEMLKENMCPTTPGRRRFSRLYIPGNTPSMMINAGLHSADGIILDLEDSVAPGKKDEARLLVRNALRQIGFNGAERMVRINQGDQGLADLDYVIPHNVNLILLPKCESAQQVINVESKIQKILSKSKIANPVYIMPIIESAIGVENSLAISKSSEKVVALAIGLEDYTADLGVPRTAEGNESFYARTRIIVAAKAAGIQPIDSVFSDVADMEALRQNILKSKALGFEGMGCIHPRQVPVINEGFAPDENEIEKSKMIVSAYEDALSNGLGVVALGSKMIDAPVVARAMKTIELAIRLGRLSEKWRDEMQAGDN
jgi:citrate lyase subunit beta / citryl-CoA lyase